MRDSYREEILDLLSDGIERTVDEIRQSIGAEPTCRIHHVLADMRERMSIRREVYRLMSRRVSGKLYYRYGKIFSSGIGENRES